MACSLSDPLFEDLPCRSDWVMAGNWVRSRPSRRSRYLPRLCAAAHVAQDVQLRPLRTVKHKRYNCSSTTISGDDQQRPITQ